MNRKRTALFIGLLIISQIAFAQNFKNYDTNRTVKSITLKKATSDALKDCYILQLEESVADTPENTPTEGVVKSTSTRHSIIITADQLNDIKRAVLYRADYFLSKIPAATFTESQLLGKNASQTIESALACHKLYIDNHKNISVADSCLSGDCPQEETHHPAESFQLSLEKKYYYFIVGEPIEREGRTTKWDIIHLNTTRTGNEAIIKVKKAALAEFFSHPQTMVP